MLAPSDKHQSHRAHRHVFWLLLALGAGGLLVAAGAVAAEVGAVHPASVGSGRIALAGLRFTYPRINTAEGLLLALAALGAIAMTSTVRAVWRQRRACRGFVAHLAILGALEKHPAVTVIADRHAQAFCAGYLRPKVFVSQRTLELLTDAELEAVLAHEHHHRRARDPLRLACGRILSQALFFVPVLRSLSDRYAELAELSADDAAVRASRGRKQPLAAALLAFDESTPAEVTGISPERVDSLLGQPVGWRVPWWLMSASVGALSTLSLLTWVTGRVASLHATFDLPLLSSQPCVVMTMFLPFLGALRMVGRCSPYRRFALRRSRLATDDAR